MPLSHEFDALGILQINACYESEIMKNPARGGAGPALQSELITEWQPSSCHHWKVVKLIRDLLETPPFEQSASFVELQ